jgi:predicted Rossmann fold flavoprotein
VTSPDALPDAEIENVPRWDCIVIGAGAAGLVAAERAASRGLRTLLLEKNRKPGVKILMSGGTRCNLTHATDRRGIVAAYGAPGRFLHSALAALSPADLVALVEAEGVQTKVEETGKIFPVSNKAIDVLNAFLDRISRTDCELALEEAVLSVKPADLGFAIKTTRRSLRTKTAIITVGGQSYPGCGTSGDGYSWLGALGHTIVPPQPALVPITTSAPWVRELSGITIPDVSLRLIEPTDNSKVLDTRRGSLLFTHFGLSGPVVLDISRHVSGHPRPQSLLLECDFLPNEKAVALDERLKQHAVNEGRKHVAGLMPELLPRRLAELLLAEAGIRIDQKAAELSKQQRTALVSAIKQLRISVTGTRGFAKAEVTAGGVALDEVDSRTMQSKLVPGLYLAGEILDLDGPIGGYNFQAAFSTGWLAGMSVEADGHNPTERL